MKEIGRKLEEGRESQRGSEIRQWAEPSSEPDGMPRLTTGFFFTDTESATDIL